MKVNRNVLYNLFAVSVILVIVYLVGFSTLAPHSGEDWVQRLLYYNSDTLLFLAFLAYGVLILLSLFRQRPFVFSLYILGFVLAFWGIERLKTGLSKIFEIGSTDAFIYISGIMGLAGVVLGVFSCVCFGKFFKMGFQPFKSISLQLPRTKRIGWFVDSPRAVSATAFALAVLAFFQRTIYPQFFGFVLPFYGLLSYFGLPFFLLLTIGILFLADARKFLDIVFDLSIILLFECLNGLRIQIASLISGFIYDPTPAMINIVLNLPGYILEILVLLYALRIAFFSGRELKKYMPRVFTL
ncbi:MAG: hypothetical protein Q8O09_02990 [Bacillota bacterium]|nr:hypothetical protein [Bacillota bacterium]